MGWQEFNPGTVSEAASPARSSCVPRDCRKPNGLFVCLHGCVGLCRGKPLSRNSAIKADGGRLIWFFRGALAGTMTTLLIPSHARSPSIVPGDGGIVFPVDLSSFLLPHKLMWYFGKQRSVCQGFYCSFSCAPSMLCPLLQPFPVLPWQFQLPPGPPADQQQPLCCCSNVGC